MILLYGSGSMFPGSDHCSFAGVGSGEGPGVSILCVMCDVSWVLRPISQTPVGP